MDSPTPPTALGAAQVKPPFCREILEEERPVSRLLALLRKAESMGQTEGRGRGVKRRPRIMNIFGFIYLLFGITSSFH